MFRKNGKDLEMLRPLKHRPDVVVVILNGTRRVMGDGAPFSSAELIELGGGLAESTQPKLRLTKDEQTQLDVAGNSLERANSYVDNIMGDLEDLSARLAAQYPSESLYYYGDSPKQDVAVIGQINRETHEARSKLGAARKIEKQALVEFNKLNAEIMTVARARQFPPQYYKPVRPTDELLSELEAGND